MKYLYSHYSQETAFEVDDYPWGFRLRTKIRYWIESKKNHGQRFCSQTINPKTGLWCAPKHSTYESIMIMTINDQGHTSYISLRQYHDEAMLNSFKADHWDFLTEFQKDQFRELLAIQQVMKHVKVEFKPVSTGPVSLFSKDPIEVAKREKMALEQEERAKERKKSESIILRAINSQFHKNKVEIV